MRVIIWPGAAADLESHHTKKKQPRNGDQPFKFVPLLFLCLVFYFTLLIPSPLFYTSY